MCSWWHKITTMRISSHSDRMDYAFIFKSLKAGVEIFIPLYSPTILIADSAPAITNRFSEAFGHRLHKGAPLNTYFSMWYLRTHRITYLFSTDFLFFSAHSILFLTKCIIIIDECILFFLPSASPIKCPVQSHFFSSAYHFFFSAH